MRSVLMFIVGLFLGISFVMDTIHLHKVTDFKQKAVELGYAKYSSKDGYFEWIDPKLKYLMGFTDKSDINYGK